MGCARRVASLRDEFDCWVYGKMALSFSGFPWTGDPITTWPQNLPTSWTLDTLELLLCIALVFDGCAPPHT